MDWCGEGKLKFASSCFQQTITYNIPSVFLFGLCIFRARASINYLFPPKYERIPWSFYLCTIILATTPLISLALLATFSLHSIGYSNVLSACLISLSWTLSTFILSSDSRSVKFPSQGLLIFYCLELFAQLFYALSPPVSSSLSTTLMVLSIVELLSLGWLTGFGFYTRETMVDDVADQDDEEFSIQQSRDEANWQDLTSLCFPMMKLRLSNLSNKSSSSSSSSKGSYSSLTGNDQGLMDDDDYENRNSAAYHFKSTSSSSGHSSMSDLGSIDASNIRRSHGGYHASQTNTSTKPSPQIKLSQASLIPSGAIVAPFSVILTPMVNADNKNDIMYEISVKRERSAEMEWYGQGNNSNNNDDDDEVSKWKVSRTTTEFHQLHADLRSHFGDDFPVREPVIKSVYSLTDYLRQVLLRREFYGFILNSFLNVVPISQIKPSVVYSPDGLASSSLSPRLDLLDSTMIVNNYIGGNNGGVDDAVNQALEVLILPPTALLSSQSSSMYIDEDVVALSTPELSTSQKDSILKIFGQLKRQLSESTCIIHFRTFHNVLRANDIIKAIKMIPTVASPLTAAQDLVSYQLLLPVCCGYADDDDDANRESAYCDDVDPTLISTFQQGHEWLYCYGDYRRISATPLTRVAMTLFEFDISVQIPVFTQKTVREADGSSKTVNVYQILVSVLDSNSSSSSLAYSLPTGASGGGSSASHLLSSFSSNIDSEVAGSVMSSSEFGDDFIPSSAGLDGESSLKPSVSTDFRSFEPPHLRAGTLVPTQHGNALDTWDCYRRYSEFLALDQFIKLRKIRLPKSLPSKKILKLSSEAQLNARRRGLEEYIQGVVRVARDNNVIAPAVAVFLDSFAERLRVRVLDSLALYFREKEAQKEQMVELEESMGV